MAAIFFQTPNTTAAKIVPADTTAFKNIWTAGANGARLNGIHVTSTDTTNRDVQLAISISGVDYILGTVQVLANTGNTNAIAAQNLLAAATIRSSMNVDQNGNLFMDFPPNAILKAKVLSAVSASREISLIGEGYNL